MSTSDFTYLTAGEREHITIALVFSVISLVACVLPIYVYFRHEERRLLWSHFNHHVIGCIAVHLVQTFIRVLSTSLLLSLVMDEAMCKDLAAIDAAFDTACHTLVLGFYYSLMAERWNPIKHLLVRWFRVSEDAYLTFKTYGWFVTALIGAVASGFLTATHDNVFWLYRGWCTGYGAPWTFAATTMAPLALIVVSAVATMLALRCCVERSGGRAIAQQLTWTQHWAVYVRFFGIIAFFLASIISTVVLHYSFDFNRASFNRAHTYVPVVIMAVWPAVLAGLFLLTEGVLHYAFQTYCCCRQYIVEKHTNIVSFVEFGEAIQYGSFDALQAAEVPPPTPTLTGGINNFTAAMNTLLGREARGI